MTVSSGVGTYGGEAMAATTHLHGSNLKIARFRLVPVPRNRAAQLGSIHSAKGCFILFVLFRMTLLIDTLVNILGKEQTMRILSGEEVLSDLVR